jgi:hypothetical protein
MVEIRLLPYGPQVALTVTLCVRTDWEPGTPSVPNPLTTDTGWRNALTLLNACSLLSSVSDRVSQLLVAQRLPGDPPRTVGCM